MQEKKSYQFKKGIQYKKKYCERFVFRGGVAKEHGNYLFAPMYENFFADLLKLFKYIKGTKYR